MEQHIQRPLSFKGEITPPADKSISHRALIFNGIAARSAQIHNFLISEDCLSTLSCLQAIGVRIERQGSQVTVHGMGEQGLFKPEKPLNAGNSGTTMRLLTGLLAAQPFKSVITGDDSLRSRPMRRVIDPLNLMGADIIGEENNTKAPLTVNGQHLKGITYRLPVASAQVKSAILLAGLYAEGKTIIEEPAPSRDHTERILQAMGATITTENLTITLNPLTTPLNPLDITVPGDISSAAFWLAAGALHPNSAIRLLNVGLNPTRSGIIDVLQSMGARIIIENQRIEGSEPVADLSVISSPVRGIDIGGSLIPRIIDEIPVIAVVAAVADGTTTIRDAAELRVKESDRIRTTVEGLHRMGAKIEELPDGMIIHGTPNLNGAICDSHGDHRLAMALAIAGTVSEGETIITNAQAVDISYPGFWHDLEKLGGQ